MIEMPDFTSVWKESISALLVGMLSALGLSKVRTKVKQDSTDVAEEGARVSVIDMLRAEVGRLVAQNERLMEEVQTLRSEMIALKTEIARYEVLLQLRGHDGSQTSSRAN